MSVSIEAIIEAPIEHVWSKIAAFQNLQRWHPLIQSCACIGAGEGAVRTVHFADWWAVERLDRLDPVAHELRYAVIDSSRSQTIGVSGTIRLDALNPAATRIAWSSGLPPENPHAPAVNAGLQAYYPLRLSHLRTALGLQDT